MLSRRQIEILLELCENASTYMTALYFAQKQQVSLRTVQGDIKAIKSELLQYPCVEFQSASQKGSRIVIKDQAAFGEFKKGFYQQFSNTSLSNQSERISKILFLLLNQIRPISYYDVENTIFISHSTLLNDLKAAGSILQRYQLELMRGSNKLMIDGSETSKRRCILEENLMVANSASILAGQDNDEQISKIKDVLVETFVAYKHTVSEVELNNMIVQLLVSLQRMENYFFVAPEDFDVGQEAEFELEMARDIFSRLGMAFSCRVPEAEINYFALYMRGRGNFASSDAISQEIDDLVLDALREIRNAYNFDLTNDVNFRIALGLHCMPMVVRIQYDMQMKNHLVDYIRQNFPQGYDIATFFASILQKKFNKRVEDGEIAYIAIHIYKALTTLQSGSGTKRVLVITSLRRSENTLIRQILYKWFGDQIAELFFLPPSLMNEQYLDKYDTFLTTEKGEFYERGLAVYINPFPDQRDFLNVKLAMDGFESINDILQLFYRDVFEIFRTDVSRDDVLNTLSQKSARFFDLPDLKDAVWAREKMGSTFFGNGIAAPHPIFPVSSSDTFISIGISPQPITWDASGNKVHLVMLVNVSKNNSKAFQIWNYLSKLFAHREFVSQLLQDPSYERFLKLLKGAISESFPG